MDARKSSGCRRNRKHSFFKFFAFTFMILLIAAPANAQAILPAQTFSPDADPDLVITDVWSSGSQIWVQVMNQGDGPTKTGFTNGLKVDGGQTITSVVSEILDPDERLNQYFTNFVWTCSELQDTILVGSDITHVIEESNDDNNSRSENWKCDQTPPEIEKGPVVTNITTTGARITWSTGESSDSQVLYDETLDTFALSKTDLTPTMNHQIDLGDLEPATLYQFKARSTDPSGNSVESEPGFFQTLPKSDTEKPGISDMSAKRLPGRFFAHRISLKADDNDEVERVEFFMDDKRIGIDYAPSPDDGTTFEWVLRLGEIGMDFVEFAGEHEFRFEAFDRSGLTYISELLYTPPEETLYGELSFNDPVPFYIEYISGSIVPAGTIIPISVHASKYFDHCGFHGCIRIEEEVDSVELYIDGHQVPDGDITNPYDLTYDYDWDISGLDEGRHSIRAVSFAGEDWMDESTTVDIETGSPRLDVERTLTRDGHIFRVDLRIENNGTLPAGLNELTDNLVGFQPVIKSSTYYTVTSEYNPSDKRSAVNIDLHSGSNPYNLNPHASLTVSYLAAPILYREIDTPVYAVGGDPVELIYDTWYSDSFDHPAAVTSAGDSLLAAIWDIQLDSDYLIVTNPCNLFAVNASDEDVDRLLSGLARMADLKDGVLAYLVGSPTADQVDDAIEAWGEFMKGYDGVDNNYLSKGYLLLVGELDIIPAHSLEIDEPWYISWKEPFTVNTTDVHYADTGSNLIDPELAVGRIIGDSAELLLIPVETDIGVDEGASGYDFDWSDALVVSGFPRHRSGTSGESDFAAVIHDVKSRLEAQGTDVDELDNTDYATRIGAVNQFFAMAPDEDIIHLAGHGNWDVVDDLEVPDFGAYLDPFDDSNPFVFVTSCLTGNYTPGDGLAETFLQKGAAAYVGSTEVSYGSVNRSNAKRFYDDWDPGDEIGPVLKNIKRDIGGFHSDNWYTGWYEDIWTAEYHIFGDPEFGDGAPAPAAAAQPAELAPISSPLASIEVTVPNYEQETTYLGKDRLVIPGGGHVMIPDMPMVPTYDYVQTLPAGVVVQGVSLSERSELQTISGVDLEVFVPVEDGTSRQLEQPLADGEWFPTADFDWGVVTNPDGVSELHIVIYPFIYNSLTQGANFYKKYIFEVATLTSTLTIPLLKTDLSSYDPGMPVLVDLRVENSGNPLTVTLSAAVHAFGSNELVDGLLMETLHALSGPATASLSWDTKAAEPGDYYILAELRNLQGDLLASETEAIRIGTILGQSYNLNAPDFFKIGDLVSLSFDFQNTGSVPITGTAVIHVEGLASGSLSEFQVPVEDLLPNSSKHIGVLWDSSNQQLEDFQVAAFVQYAGQSTPPLTKVMQTTLKSHLPVIRR